MEREFLVEGYRFLSEEEAKKAERELAKIKALDEKLDEDNHAAVKALYIKAVDQQVFETQIGFAYLRNLQSYLIAEGALLPDEKPLPVLYSKVQQEKEISDIKEEYYAREKELEQITEGKIAAQKEQILQAKQKCRSFMIVSAVLAVMVIGMFLITLTGKNENILNYKNAITNQYAEWEQELSQREAAVRQKELELNMEP